MRALAWNFSQLVRPFLPPMRINMPWLVMLFF